MAHPEPIQSWKSILPWVVSAVKLGASLLILNAMMSLLCSRNVETPTGRLVSRPTRAEVGSVPPRWGAARCPSVCRPLYIAFDAASAPEASGREQASDGPDRIASQGEAEWAILGAPPALWVGRGRGGHRARPLQGGRMLAIWVKVRIKPALRQR